MIVKKSSTEYGHPSLMICVKESDGYCELIESYRSQPTPWNPTGANLRRNGMRAEDFADLADATIDEIADHPEIVAKAIRTNGITQ